MKKILFLLISVLWMLDACSNSETLDDPQDILEVPQDTLDVLPDDTLEVLPDTSNDSLDTLDSLDKLDSLDTLDYLESLALPGFSLIWAKGDSVLLGTDKKSASIKDRPAMQSRFDYDFLMGLHEVTCGEMHAECEDSLPVTDVTFYDAVLYCNKRSVAEGFDTAYSYTAATFDESGSCIRLDGFAFHPDVNAYRLPTEAEWIYVASQDWMPQEGWHSENSNFDRHPVCSAKVDSNGICDMAGNVMEWVGDLLVPFQSTSVTDFAGGKSSGGIEERVLKGGSFRNDPGAIHLYSRGDVYTVTASTKFVYVGFRLAFGAIPNPTFMDKRGRTQQETFLMNAGKSAIESVIGRTSAKMVFRDDVSGNLVYVDFSYENALVSEIDVGVSAYHPDISPDGKYVAFCTGVEGVSGKSELYVRRLASEDFPLIKLNVESAAVPRWRVLPSGDTVITYVTDAGSNKSDASFYAASTWQVPFVNGAFGTPVKLVDGNYHGGISKDNSLFVTGSPVLRTRVNGNETTWYNGEQACNVSLSRGAETKTLFLDFSGKTGRAYAGERYSVHKRVFFMDQTGALERSLSAPTGYTFDHTEWVVGSDSFFVATLSNSEGAHRKIVLENAYTGETLELVSGNELWHPAFWCETSEVLWDEALDLDSAGIYFVEGMPFYALELRSKMESFWKKRSLMTVAVLGSSRLMYGVNDAFVPSEMLVNMAFSSGDIYGMCYLAMNYVLKLAPQLKFLVLEFSPDFLWVTENASWVPIYANTPGFLYDENHGFWVDSIPYGFEYLVEKSIKPFSEFILPYDSEDFLLQPAGGWGTPEIYRDTMLYSLEDPLYAKNMELFADVIDVANAQGVKVVLIVPPQNPGYAETGSFGIYSVRRSLAEIILEQAGQFNAVLMDENKMGYHDYISDMAYNTDHLSRSGTMQLSGRLDSLLRVIKK